MKIFSSKGYPLKMILQGTGGFELFHVQLIMAVVNQCL